MLADDVQVVSVDDHVLEPPNVWQNRLPAKYKEVGPKNVRDGSGRDVWVFEGEPHYNVGLGAVAGKEYKDFGLDPVSYNEMRPGCYDIEERIRDMDVDGIHAQLCFPSFPGFCGSTLMAAKDKDLANTCVSVWNDWMIEEWCGAAPDRQIPLALVPMWDIEAATAEATRIIERAGLSPRPIAPN